jgi:trans-feruloyl-CoA hydratase/vanillin synthase
MREFCWTQNSQVGALENTATNECKMRSNSDVAIAAEDAQFGLSEANWGILPAGNASRAVAETMRTRVALYYIMTGELFDGRKAAEMGLVNEVVPKEKLRERVRELADSLLEKSLAVLKGTKDAFKRVLQLDWDLSEDYLISKREQPRLLREGAAGA